MRALWISWKKKNTANIFILTPVVDAYNPFDSHFSNYHQGVSWIRFQLYYSIVWKKVRLKREKRISLEFDWQRKKKENKRVVIVKEIRRRRIGEKKIKPSGNLETTATRCGGGSGQHDSSWQIEFTFARRVRSLRECITACRWQRDNPSPWAYAVLFIYLFISDRRFLY